MNNPDVRYRGRFAPSPTGPLHFGSLIAAVGSYLQARSQNGEWLVRIDDIDPPREAAGAADHIIHSLQVFGFEWDQPVSYQSRHSDRYLQALAQLQAQGDVYPCGCSRKDILESEQLPGIYPGTCRNGLSAGKIPRQLRLRVDNELIEFADGLQGLQQFSAMTDIGDFVIRRADGLFAYQLATAVDDADQGMTEVVRGCDLLDSTPRQILIRQRLGLPNPRYIHLPVAINPNGQKLSKQNFATGLDLSNPVPQLCNALIFLGQAVPTALQTVSLPELWSWAITNWQLTSVPPRAAIPI
ncbi:MAG: tRNA glutamyl-Q(34) synthetase GluQRS [Gammaproteobacteria bacterium]|nr:tRNA glutamyl-Q(34) synthetase GluQRS [Gammaproteobacteria bacterium]MDH5653025.1 tRNA glutamyl-Q(34) synthetase GluQRS [Gammaproteobacteria bacterium]